MQPTEILARRLRELADDHARLAERQRQLATELAEIRSTAPDEALSFADIKARYGIGSRALHAAEMRGELKIERRTGRGKQYVRLSDFEHWLQTSKPKPTKSEEDFVARQVRLLSKGAA